MAKSNVNNCFANVIFHDIEDIISLDQYLTCHYTVSDTVGHSPRDWIGLFKVGWRSTSDYVTYEWAAAPRSYTEKSTNNIIISFHADSTLHENEDDFYQFCYVDCKDNIQGMSLPFRIKFGDDFVEMEEEEDGEIVVIKSRTSFLEEIKKEKFDFQTKTSKLEMERDKLLTKIELLEGELKQMTQERNVERKEKEEIAKVLEEIIKSRKNGDIRRHRSKTYHSTDCIHGDSVQLEMHDESNALDDYRQHRGCSCVRLTSSKSSPSSESKLQEKNCIESVEVNKQFGESQIAAAAPTVKEKLLFNPMIPIKSIRWPSSKITGSNTDSEVGLNMICFLKENMDPFSTESYFDEMEYMTVEVDSLEESKSKKFSTLSPTRSNDTVFRWALLDEDEDVRGGGGGGAMKRKDHSVHRRKTAECPYCQNVFDVDSSEEEFHDHILMHADYFNLSAML